MKPFRVETPLTLYSGRTRSSCTNCRYGKKKCDEARPVCGNCAKGGKYDCAYDGQYGYPATQQQQAQMGGWAASPVGVAESTPPVSANAGAGGYGGGYQGKGQGQKYPGFVPQQQYHGQRQQYQAQTMGQYQQQQQSHAGGQREESPDPWFPKRSQPDQASEF